MILKEFDLDLPYIEGSPEDYKLNWKHKRIKFNNECRCVAAMAERYFKEYRYKTPFSWKLMVSCYSELDNVKNKFVKSEVYEANMRFDIDRYFTSTANDKKLMIFEVLKEGVLEIVKEEGWISEPFKEVFSKMEDEQLKNIYQLGKFSYNSKRHLNAAIVCEHEINEFKMFIIIRDSSGREIAKKLVINEVPNEWSFHKHLGKLQWLSDHEVALINKKGIVVNTLQVDYDW